MAATGATSGSVDVSGGRMMHGLRTIPRGGRRLQGGRGRGLCVNTATDRMGCFLVRSGVWARLLTDS